MTASTTARCPSCSLPVIPTDHVLLDAKPHELGVYRVDGTPMRRGEWLRFWSAERPVGRRVHMCGRERVAA